MRSGSPGSRRLPARVEALRDYQRRVHRWFTISAGLGLVVGLAVGSFHLLVEDLTWNEVGGLAPWPVLVFLPTLGLLLGRVVLSVSRAADGDTTEGYIASFHGQRGRLRLRDLWSRLAAAGLTVGSGGSLGLEGPSVLVGGTLGAAVQTRFRTLFVGEDARVLMVAGAAAGVAAIFRAPLTGLIFAIEVPFKDDIARHALLPALVASATGYLGQALLFGTDPLFPLREVPAFTARDLLATAVVGAACGGLARIFVRALRGAVTATADWPIARRIAVGGLTCGVAVGLSALLWEAPLAGGTGYNAIRSVLAGDLATSSALTSAAALAALLVLKATASGGTIVGGGVGGVFIPLVTLGAITGTLVALLLRAWPLPGIDAQLFPLVGMAAFLGAGYHTPLAAVAFVAETTGSPNYIVAGLVASAVAYGVMGRRSISANQRMARRGHTETILAAATSTAVSSPPVIVSPSTSVREFVRSYLLRSKHREYPVVADERLVGVIRLEHLNGIDAVHWDELSVGDVMDTDPATVRSDEPLAAAAEVLAAQDVDRVVVVDRAGRVTGVIGARDVFRFAEILEEIRRSTHG